MLEVNSFIRSFVGFTRG